MREREEVHGRGEDSEEEKENGMVVALLERAARERKEDAIGETKKIC